jgi:SPOR domain
MADDQNQRPYRSNQPLPRATPAATVSGSDPLAELARLIGQTDPFAEYGRDTARRTAAPPPVANWSAPPAAAAAAQPLAPEAPPYVAPSLTRQPYAADRFLYQDDEAVTSDHPAVDTARFEQDPYHPSNAQLAGEEEDFYEDGPPTKRRMGIMAIAAIFALAVIGTAGAFGYRALFGSSGPSQPPPVVKADTAPSKIVPVTASKTPNKLITDRVADHAQDEKLVSREEQPVEMKDKPAAVVPPQSHDSAQPASAQPPTLGSGVISSEPKKIHTIAIRPDQPGLGDNQPVATTAPAPPAPPPGRTAAPAPTAPTAPTAPLAQSASNPPVGTNAEPPAPRQSEARAAAPVRHTTASGPSNAPLSLSPDAPAARAPMRTAAVAAPIARTAKPAAAAASGSYAVQVSSQRSEADAQAAFRSLQAKYPNQLAGRQALIHKVELGDKGTYYRAMVGPFASANEAGELCSGLKAAGGQCLVQKN